MKQRMTSQNQIHICVLLKSSKQYIQWLEKKSQAVAPTNEKALKQKTQIKGHKENMLTYRKVYKCILIHNKTKSIYSDKENNKLHCLLSSDTPFVYCLPYSRLLFYQTLLPCMQNNGEISTRMSKQSLAAAFANTTWRECTLRKGKLTWKSSIKPV